LGCAQHFDDDYCALRDARLPCADEGISVSSRVTFQLKGASRGPLYLGLRPRLFLFGSSRAASKEFWIIFL